MKVIVTKLLGSAEVEFLREGVVVHRERFAGEKPSSILTEPVVKRVIEEWLQQVTV